MRLKATLVASLLATSSALASPSQELDRAKAQYKSGEYQKAVDTLRPQLYPRARLTDPSELLDAHELLGVAYFYLGKQDLAYAEFLAVLKLDPNRELDPVENSADVYAFFEAIKRENQKTLELIRKQKEIEEAKKKRPSRQITIVREYHPQETWRNWVPFGVGQYHNGQPGKGTVFLAVQAGTLALSVGAFTYQLLRFGIDFKQDFRPEEVDLIFALQVTQIASGAAFLGAYGLGVWDAYRNQKPRWTESRKEEVLESRLRLSPLVGPSTVGAAATWEF